MNKKRIIDYSKIDSLPDLINQLRLYEIPNSEYWRYVAAYQERKARMKGVPLSGTFEITPLCNLDCKMCYVHLNNEQLNGTKLMSGQWWKDLMFKAHSFGMMNATLTGGECLTHPDFDELYLFLRGMGVSINVKTNGVLLDIERIAFFRKYPPKSITISLYGSSNDAYKMVTGHAAFDSVYNNLLQLKNSVEFPISIAITPSKYMYNDMKEILNLVSQLRIPYSINVALFQPRKETGRVSCDLTPSEYTEIYKLIRTNNDIVHKASTKEASIELSEQNDNSHSAYGIQCGAGKSSFFVGWNGLMSACDNLNSSKISLIENSFKEAWDLIRLEAMTYPLPSECFNCKYEKVCFRCVAYRNNGVEKGHCNPTVCERTKLLVTEKIYMVGE